MVCYEFAEVMRRLKRRVQEAGSQHAYAHRIGISQSYLSDILLGRRRIPPKVLRCLRLQRVEHYQSWPSQPPNQSAP